MPLPEIDLEDTNYGRILEAVRLTLAGLGLPGIDSTNIVVTKLGWIEVDAVYPRIIIEPRPEIANPDAGTNERDDTVYPVMIAMLFAGGLDDTSRDLGLHLYWRQVVLRTHRNKTANDYTNLSLAAGNSLLRITMEPGDVFIEQAKRQQLNGQYLLARFTVREPRT